MRRVILSAALVAAGGAVAVAAHHHGNEWSRIDLPTESIIAGGPWTLEQAAASTALPSAGYCVGGVQQTNPAIERMQPYYFPLTVGSGEHLQGYFDYRPKDNNEAIVAAVSDDAGRSWTFQQEVLRLTNDCPASEAVTRGNDDGQGHPFVLAVGGVTRLYTLDRSAGNVDAAGLVVHALAPSPAAPLTPAPALLDVPQRTTGLLSPDGIFAVVPGAQPTTVLYLQKQLQGDVSFPAAQQCPGKSANHDVVTVRLASTVDGVSFTDLGAVSGLNDSTTVAADGMRWVGPRGTVVRFADGRFGLFFSGGSCIDNDSDAFHFIGYAESNDARSWHIVNGMNNPIASVAPVTVGGVTIPATTPVVGTTQGWFSGRVYGPSVTLLGGRAVTLTFAGYHTAKPKNDMGDYRSIGRVLLRAAHELSTCDDD
jgi:hypothetical protein